jgi:hypothetical protein
MNGLGHKQLTADGSLRFPFNPGPVKGKYPGIRHKRTKRVKESGLDQAVAMSLMVKMASFFRRFRRPV